MKLNFLSKKISGLLITAITSTLIISCTSSISLNEIPFNTEAIDTETKNQLVYVNYKESTKNKKPAAENAIFQAIVTKLLPDDNDGLKHQLFMIRITSEKYQGAIVKVAHNTGVAPQVPVQIGSIVEIKGDFLANESPMVLH